MTCHEGTAKLPSVRFFFLLAFMHGLLVARGQQGAALVGSDEVLLTNKLVQLEVTSAMHFMYSFEFDKAHREYRYLKSKYSWHPMPYFMTALNYWWQMVPNVLNTSYDEQFLAELDTARVLSRHVYERVSEAEGAFFLSAIHGFLGRFHSDRGSLLKAAREGKRSIKFLQITRGYDDFSPELYLGDGLFNYYVDWIRENYPLLRPLIAVLPDGDKQKGIEQLKHSARNAFYTRTEAQHYLMRILLVDEGDLQGALQIAEYLHESYPSNPYFHRYLAMTYFRMGRFEELMPLSYSIIEGVEQLKPGYESNTLRYASYFLGRAHESRGEYEEAKVHYRRCERVSEELDVQKRGYSVNSLFRLGRIHHLEGSLDKALAYYRRVRKLTKRKAANNKAAAEHIRSIKKRDSKRR